MQLELDRVMFVPVGVAPHRTIDDDPGPEARLEMVELAISDDERFTTSRIEMDRAGPSYTADTLEQLRAESPDDELFLILGGDDDSTTPRSQSVNAPSGMPMTGGSGTSQSASSTVQVQLGEMYVKPSASTVPAGRVKFVARNVGSVEHELMIERMPIRLDAPGMPTEDAAMGMIDEMGSMDRGEMTLRLTPGKYELFCNVPGHYAAGQRTTLTVTR